MGHLNANPVLDATEDKTMILNMGPQHPSTHGVLRLLLEIDGGISQAPSSFLHGHYIAQVVDSMGQ